MSLIKNLIIFIDKIINISVFLVMILILLFCTYSIYINNRILITAKLSDDILKLEPKIEEKDNYSFDKVLEINNNICGWIKIENTNINYPIVQGKDNYVYLNQNYKGEYSPSGSIFLDSTNSNKFDDKYSIVFGHNMTKNAMFSDVIKFKKKKYFEEHSMGYLFTDSNTYELYVYSYMEVDAYDYNIYYLEENNKKETNEELIEYIKNNSKHFKDFNINGNDKILALSTCLEAGTSKRAILILKMKEIASKSKEEIEDEINTIDQNGIIVKEEYIDYIKCLKWIWLILRY